MSRPALPPVPSHAAFLRSQIRSSLAHLQATNELDQESFDQIMGILSGKVSDTSSRSDNDRKERGDVGRGEGGSSEVDALKEKLSTDKDWLRHALIETSLIPSTVDWALSIAVPSALLGDTQRDAIVELVTLSQQKIALAITNPALQNKTKSATFASAKGAHAGIRKGWNAAGQSFDGIGKKRAEMKKKSDAKKAEKQEQKEIKRELQREREEIVRKRQQNLLVSESGAGSERGNEDEKKQKEKQQGEEESQRIGKDALTTTKGKSQPALSSDRSARNAPMDTDVDGEAMVSVSCAEVSPQGSVAATTMFSPWPGLLLTSTLVASNDSGDSDDVEEDVDEDEGGQGKVAPDEKTLNLSEANMQRMNDRNDEAATSLPPPPRRAAPPSMSRSGGSDVGTPPLQPPLQGGRDDITSQQQQPFITAASSPTNETIDVTEAKQKSWTKRLGL